MSRRSSWPVIAAAVLMLAATAIPAQADHKSRPATKNIHALGHSAHAGTFEVSDGARVISSDIAFQGKLAYQGNYDGFRVIDISAPGNPKLLSHPSCNGDQGDIVVYEDVLVRSWNSKKSSDRLCDSTLVPAGWEGVHIFDISDPSDPGLVGSVELPCGSHTATAAGVDDGDLIVYSNNSSSSGCGVGLDLAGQNAVGDFMDVIAVPLGDPGSASLIHREPLAGPADPAVRTGCHDVGVILGEVNRAACASADTINVWDVTDPRDPAPLFTISEPGVGDSSTNGRWHSAAWTWDGEVIVAGWEPGGGGAAECEASDPDVDKSLFFYDGTTGAKLGEWVLPRGQGADENCTIHNFNLVPLKKGGYVVVAGHYQAGTWVVDLSDPAAPETIAWSDPESLGPGSFCGGACQIGGAWSTYWYNGELYESDITTGLNVLKVSDKVMQPTIKLGRLNPQTQEFSL